MHLRFPAIVCALRPHGEAGGVAHVFSEDHGLVAGYVPGARGRQLRPVLIPGNGIDCELRARADSQLPTLRTELTASRAPWLGEPMPAAAIGWVTALTAAAMPDRQPHPPLFGALEAVLDAICLAPSARGWLAVLVGFEVLLLRELGHGRQSSGAALPEPADFSANLALFDRLAGPLARYALAHRRSDVMAARAMLRERLGRIV